MTIAECQRRVAAAAAREDDCIDSVISDKEFNTAMLDMERGRLFSGARADGTETEPPYKPFTIFKKIQKGQPYDRVTLFDTGDFYSGFTAERDGDSVLFTSTDPKTAKLEGKYGEEIFGLDEFSKDKTQQMSVPLILRWFKDETGL